MLRAWHLSFIFLMVIFFWPTYLFGVGYDFGQKAYYFVCALFAVVLAMVAGAGRISINGLALVSPLIFLFASVFILRLPVASFFEVGILIKLTLLFTVLHSAYLFIKPSLEFGREGDFVKAINIVFFLQFLFIVTQFIFPESDLLKVWNAHPVNSYWGFRAPGAFEWVYSLCFVSVFILAYSGFGLNVKANKSCSRFYYLLLFLIFMIIVVLSQSKAGYVSLFLTLVYGLILDRVLTGKLARTLIFVMGVFVALLFLLIIRLDIDFSYIANFFDGLSTGELDGSTSYRRYQIELAISSGLENWYRGTVFNDDMIIIENAYFDYLYRYGIAGLFFYCIFSLSLFFYSLSILRKVAKNYIHGMESSRIYRLMLAVHLTFFSALWFSFSFAPLDGYKTSVWSYFCLAIALVIAHRQTTIRRSCTTNCIQ